MGNLFEKPESDPRLHTFVRSFGNCSPLRSSVIRAPPYIKQFCDLIPLKNIKNIYGPISYTEHVLGRKTICIFGDEHNVSRTVAPAHLQKSDTTTVPSLLRAMLETHPDRFYDFFIEMQHIKSDRQTRTSGLYAFDHIFKDCLRVVKNCPFANLRAHYGDYRVVVGNSGAENVGVGFMNTIIDKLYQFEENPNDPFYDKENLIRVVTNLQTRIEQLLVDDPKLIKTVDHHIASFIFKIIDYNIEIFQSIVSKRLALSKSEKWAVMTCVIKLYSAIMDAYMLGRIFKTFDVSKNPTHPSHADNCIVYVGDYHAAVYRTFLKQQGFEQVIKITGNYSIEFTEEQRRTSFLFN